jgi:hypothetical protein
MTENEFGISLTVVLLFSVLTQETQVIIIIIIIIIVIIVIIIIMQKFPQIY